MIKSRTIIGLALITAVVVAATLPDFTGAGAQQPESFRSPSAIAVDDVRGIVYAADYTGRQITVLDARSRSPITDIPVIGRPTALALSPDGGRLYAACGESNGSVAVIDTRDRWVVDTWQAGHTPTGLNLSPDGGTLYVVNRFDNSVSVLDTRSGEKTGSIPQMREPVAAAISPDGGMIYVANHLPTTNKIGEYIIDGGYMDLPGYPYNSQYQMSCVVLAAGTDDNRLRSVAVLPNGSTGVRGICISPDGRFLYVTHIIAHYQLPTSRIDSGWMNVNALTIIRADERQMTIVNTVLLDSADLGAANPWGVACSPDGRSLVVSHAGTREISIIDRVALHDRLARAARGERVTAITHSAKDVVRDLTFLDGIRRRIDLAGDGPRDITITGDAVWVGEYYAGILERIPLGDSDGAFTISLGPQPPETPERRGEMLFNDAIMCREHWQSCASCHPDARADGFNWDLLNDGIGNAKNTKSLLNSHVTPPVMITGIRADAETAVRAGIKYIEFAERPEADATAIDAYLRSLEPVPSPYLVDGAMNQYARRGHEVFITAGCAECHPAPYYTDLKKYDVGTGKGLEFQKEFDTPALVEIWRTEPYLYHGDAKNFEELLRAYNRTNHHGRTSRLSYQDINDLIEYLLAL